VSLALAGDAEASIMLDRFFFFFFFFFFLTGTTWVSTAGGDAVTRGGAMVVPGGGGTASPDEGGGTLIPSDGGPAATGGGGATTEVPDLTLGGPKAGGVATAEGELAGLFAAMLDFLLPLFFFRTIGAGGDIVDANSAFAFLNFDFESWGFLGEPAWPAPTIDPAPRTPLLSLVFDF